MESDVSESAITSLDKKIVHFINALEPPSNSWPIGAKGNHIYTEVVAYASLILLHSKAHSDKCLYSARRIVDIVAGVHTDDRIHLGPLIIVSGAFCMTV